MRKVWTLVLAAVFALGAFVLGTPAANAFGTEVLGCKYGSASWTANSCSGAFDLATFSPSNLSGAYSYSWTLTQHGSPVINICGSGAYSTCISSGCTSTSSTCTVDIQGTLHYQTTVVASLVLTQSGQSRTIQASANEAGIRPCINGC
jgi:hypothetical protein